MTFAKVSRRPLGTLATVGLFLLAAYPARVGAATASYHLDGHVTRILGAAQTGLTALGVHKDANISIDWTVDLSTPVHFDNAGTHTKEYLGAITAFKIQVGSWTADGVDPSAGVPMNKIDIRDVGPTDPNSQDNMDLFRSGTDTNSLVTGSDPNGAQLILHLFAPSGGGSTDNVLGDQTPSAYPASTGTVSGMNGEVDFSIGAIPGPDPTAKCRSAQIASAGTLCQGTLTCLSINARAPARDPGGIKLAACRDKAEKRFVTSFDKAAALAARKGLSCGTTETGATFISHFDTAVDGVIAVADTINPPVPTLLSSWYTAAGAMCNAAAKAEANNAAKPSPTKLSQLRATARARLTLAANNAVARAEKKGVTFDPQPDITAFVDSIDALIDGVVTELNGP